MPKTVLDQEGKFKQDEIFRRLSIDNKICYTGDSPGSSDIRRDLKAGKLNIAFVECGINLRLTFQSPWSEDVESIDSENIKFENDIVHIQSHFILNGVCVKLIGQLHLTDLTGTARIEFNHKMAKEEHLSYISQLADYSSQFGDQDPRADDLSQLPDAIQ